MRPIRSRSASPLASLAALALLCGLALGGCTAVREPALESRQVPEYTIEEILGTTAYRGASFSSDGTTVLVSSDQSGVFNAASVSITGGDPVPLTDSKTESILVASAFPADDRFLYLADQGGNELNHLYVREKDGSTTDRTRGENLKAALLAR